MEQVNRPGKERVREWLMRRQANPTPPPNLEQIRRELGWSLVKPPHRAA